MGQEGAPRDSVGKRFRGVRAAFAAATVASGAFERHAFAQNADSFFFSGDAALSGGAVTATTRDAGAIWYNPAGLGGNHRAQLELSGTTFGIRIRPMNDVVRTSLPGSLKSSDLRSADILSVPNAIAFVRHVSDAVSFGAGLFVNERDLRTTEDTFETADTRGAGPALNVYRQRVDLSTDRSGYRFGPALGWAIRPDLRVGISLFGTYRTVSEFRQFSADVGPGQTSSSLGARDFILGQSRRTITSFGLTFQGGLQWMPTKGVTVGALVRAPEFFLGSSARGAEITASGSSSTGDGSTFTLEKPTSDENAFAVVAPFRAVFAVATAIGPRSWLSAEADLQSALNSETASKEVVVNSRIGALVALGPSWTVGCGLFTDRASHRTLTSAFDERVDYYGIATGIEKRTRLALSSDPNPEALVLSTTLAVRYAMGFARIAAVDLDPAARNRTISSLYHDIMPYFGSAILF